MFTSKIEDNHFKIYINGLIHLNLKMDEFIGIKSYMEPDKTSQYFIEFHMKTKMILCRYNQKSKWISMLKLLDKSQPQLWCK